MTIQSIEQVLDSAIALLMYGSGAWLSYSLVAFVATRPRSAVEAMADDEMPSGGSISIEVISELISTDLVAEAVEEVQTAVTSTETNSSEVVPAAKAAVAPVPLLPPAIVPEIVPPPIVCEPVNWKKWKVGELRQASITKVCGVRISPIGSSRKLKKADLIAQYEQNLRRMTYEKGKVEVQDEKIA